MRGNELTARYRAFYVDVSFIMTRKPHHYYSRFVFSLAPVLPEINEGARELKRHTPQGLEKIPEDKIVSAWVMFQLERHLYLNLEINPQRSESLLLTNLLPPGYLQGYLPQRDLLIGQIQPVLLRGEVIPYLERYCRVEIQGPDMQLQFL